MRYTYKERVIIAQKLKVFLAVFFVVGLFLFGSLIFDKSFAIDDEDYGTATVTFNAGPGGHFEDGSTVNTVTYKLTKQMTSHSHTPNILDDGTKK